MKTYPLSIHTKDNIHILLKGTNIVCYEYFLCIYINYIFPPSRLIIFVPIKIELGKYCNKYKCREEF